MTVDCRCRTIFGEIVEFCLKPLHVVNRVGSSQPSPGGCVLLWKRHDNGSTHVRHEACWRRNLRRLEHPRQPDLWWKRHCSGINRHGPSRSIWSNDVSGSGLTRLYYWRVLRLRFSDRSSRTHGAIEISGIPYLRTFWTSASFGCYCNHSMLS